MRTGRPLIPPRRFRSSKYARLASDVGRTISATAPVTPHTKPISMGSPDAGVVAAALVADGAAVLDATAQAEHNSETVASSDTPSEVNDRFGCMAPRLPLD